MSEHRISRSEHDEFCACGDYDHCPMVTGQPRPVSATPSDLERVAITLLRDAQIELPALAQFVTHVVGDATVTDYPPTDLLDLLRGREAALHLYPVDPAIEGAWPTEWVTDRVVRQDAAAFSLAFAVVQHREEGRPTGDVCRSLGHGTGLAVITSIGAAIVEYHQRICNAYATEILHLEGRR
jgi:hypothetical protein